MRGGGTEIHGSRKPKLVTTRPSKSRAANKRICWSCGQRQVYVGSGRGPGRSRKRGKLYPKSTRRLPKDPTARIYWRQKICSGTLTGKVQAQRPGRGAHE